MSYFFISKQLLWELFFRISNSNLSKMNPTLLTQDALPEETLPGGITIAAYTPKTANLPEAVKTNYGIIQYIVFSANTNHWCFATLYANYSDRIFYARKANTDSWSNWKEFSIK